MQAANHLNRVAWLLALVGLAGCQGGPAMLDSDPLVGGSPIPSATAGRLPPPGRSIDPVRPGELPPPPPTHGATSIGALAVGAYDSQERPPGREATLGDPRRTEGLLTPTAGVPPVSMNLPPAGQNYERLQQTLLARGVNWQQLKNLQGDEWEFSCAVPLGPNVSKRYVVTAVGPMGLAAIQAAITRIDSDRPR